MPTDPPWPGLCAVVQETRPPEPLGQGYDRTSPKSQDGTHMEKSKGRTSGHPQTPAERKVQDQVSGEA